MYTVTLVVCSVQAPASPLQLQDSPTPSLQLLKETLVSPYLSGFSFNFFYLFIYLFFIFYFFWGGVLCGFSCCCCCCLFVCFLFCFCYCWLVVLFMILEEVGCQIQTPNIDKQQTILTFYNFISDEK